MNRQHRTLPNLRISSNEVALIVATIAAIPLTVIRSRGRILGLHTEVVQSYVIHVRLDARHLHRVSPIFLRRHEAIQDSDIPINQLRTAHRIVAISVALQTISSLNALSGSELREAQLVIHLVRHPKLNVLRLRAPVHTDRRRKTMSEGELGYSSSRTLGPL